MAFRIFGFLLLCCVLGFVGVSSTNAQNDPFVSNPVIINVAAFWDGGTSPALHGSVVSVFPVPPGSLVRVSGSGSSHEVPGTPLTYEWEIQSGPYDWIVLDDRGVENADEVFLRVPNQAYIDLVKEGNTDWHYIHVRLTVSDPNGNSNVAWASIPLGIVGRPIAVAVTNLEREEKTADPGTTVQLTGVLSRHDTPDTPVTYRWAIKQGPYDWIELEGRGLTQDTSLTIPNQRFVDSISENYPNKYRIVVALTLTDPNNNSDTTEIVIPITRKQTTPAPAPVPTPVSTPAPAPIPVVTATPAAAPQATPTPAPIPTATPAVPAPLPQPTETPTTTQMAAEISRLRTIVQQQQTLIVTQENLLNSYRCLFNIDTQIVPQGCNTVS